MVTRTDPLPRPAPTSLARAGWGDPAVLLCISTCSLVVVGLIMILSASSVSSFARYGSSFLFFNKQLVWVVLGSLVFVLCARLDYRRLRRIGYAAYGLALVAVAAVMVPGLGVSAGGSSRWLGAGALTFQPSEFAKLALVLFVAEVLARKQEAKLDVLDHALVPVVPAAGAMALVVVLQPDLGTAVLLGGIALGMLFVAGAPLRYVAATGAAGAALATAAALAEPYRRARVLSFLNPWADPLNSGYQVIQSLIALGSGGWFGVGLGASRQKWSYIPNAHTDFIFAILGEEMGLLGTLSVVAMFAFIAYLGVRTARSAPDRFGTLVASGITVWISLQALVNMGAVTASLPITGVPLPLVSFGGSSLVVSLAAMGMLVSIARRGNAGAARRPPRRS